MVAEATRIPGNQSAWVMMRHMYYSELLDFALYILYSKTVARNIHGEVFRSNFWMRKYRSMSFKRSSCWGNSRAVALLDCGKLSKNERRGTLKTTHKSTDSSGRVRYQGNANLKNTQMLRVACRNYCGMGWWQI